MISSMTGFGRGEASDSKREYRVEIKSVNHRFLELKIRIPRELQHLEPKVRAQIGSKIIRGSVDVNINREAKPGSDEQKLDLNLPLAKKYFLALNAISKTLKLKSAVTPETIARFPEVLNISVSKLNYEKETSLMSNGIKRALENLVKMRKSEGGRLEQILRNELNHLEKLYRNISLLREKNIKQYRDKLSDRINKLKLDSGLDPNRLAQEVALYAERSDITEELDRLNSHIKQFRYALREGGSVGRKCDFIVQELLREANTIGSKLSDKSTGKLVEMKSSIEKLKEQVQNIE